MFLEIRISHNDERINPSEFYNGYKNIYALTTEAQICEAKMIELKEERDNLSIIMENSITHFH